MLESIERDRGELSLDFLASLPLEEARGYLTSLGGVGPKTAACVLLFALGMPALPVDTHVHRVSRRLGLLGPTVNAEAAHRLLEAAIPALRDVRRPHAADPARAGDLQGAPSPLRRLPARRRLPEGWRRDGDR